MVAPPATGATQAQNASAKTNASNRMNGVMPNMAPPSFPYSARRAQPLNMNTVERKGQLSSRDPPPRPRVHGLPEAPTFRPTEAEFRDPMEYIRSISEKASKYGICKIIPPDNWNPKFAIDSERFHFRTRKQEINLVEGGNRTNLNYLDKLAQFHKQFGTQLNRFPSVDKRPLDLYKLKKAVEVRGGFEKVCKDKKWAEIGRDLGYSGKIMSSLSTSLKNSYQRWLHPYEEYLKHNKPGFSQMAPLDQTGAFSPAANSQQQTPAVYPHPPQSAPPAILNGSPAIKASMALQATVDSPQPSTRPPPVPALASRPASASGFTAVNTSGFAAVNAPSGFPAINHPAVTPIKAEPNGVSLAPTHHGFATVNGHIGGHNAVNGSPLLNGLAKSNPLKRTMSHESLNGDSGSDQALADSDNANGRRSKRPKKASDINGTPGLRAATPQGKSRSTPRRQGEKCETCGRSDDKLNIVVCDGCDIGYHRQCLDPPMTHFPDYDWHCSKCLVGNNEYGFEEGSIYSLKTFQEKANMFKDNYFAGRVPFDPVTNKPRKINEEDVEKEFWSLVEDLENSVEVEYGADIHSTTHGSGFPSIEKDPLDPISRDPWNLNVLPFHEDSLFRHIKGDISGMTVPWLYVGMCFSTFCWHNEDHYAYSANYQHFGSTKTWYGIPGKDALAFESAMRQAVPELFESQPDLLFQLVTILPPDQLRKAGVEVYALDQRAGQFVITFPQAYHAGFNHGFNFNEAVNFAPADWEPFGDAGVQRLQEFRRQPCFSHEELLFTAAASDTTIKTAKWLGPALARTRDRELTHREQFAARHRSAHPHSDCNLKLLAGEPPSECGLIVRIQNDELEEEEYQCHYCKAFSYLSQFRCATSNKVSCLLHADVMDCCNEPHNQRLSSANHSVILRYTDDDLQVVVQKVVDKANVPQAWENRLEALLEGEARPPLKQMHTLLTEGEKIPARLNGLDDLAEFVKRCDQWVEEANLYLTRKQQNRRKNEKVWRRSSTRNNKPEEKEPETQLTLERMKELIDDGEQLGFSAPQFEALQEKLANINEWRDSVKGVFEARVNKTAEELEGLLDEGKALMIAMPELTNLENLTLRAQWGDHVEKARVDMSNQSLDDCKALLKRATDLSIPLGHPQVAFLNEMVQKGGFWEDKAKEVMAAADVHYPQLESLHNQVQAQSFPVNKETLAQMDAILAKNREAKRQIITLVERSHDPDFRRRPMYVHVRDVLKDLESLNGKPHGTTDLEKEIKRHEDWMRKGKKLFGKANAPLHILEQHMKSVEERNNFCFDLNDTFRPPIEPASREASPIDGQEKPGLGDEEKPVFCLCRQIEAGLMIECEICHDWYHAKCLKLARGRVKEYETFTCPVCDWRVKIPRDAARPKLEDLIQWAEEVPDLPFQPEEEELLRRILDKAQAFRDFLSQYTNGNQLCRTAEEMPEMLFYLRKIEGAEVLLAYETNVFRQELHKWQPIAPEPPPISDQSLSTRKPRPTKQQKLMKEFGVEKPEDLPAHLRTKTYMRRKPNETYATGTLMPKPTPDSPSVQGSVNSPGPGQSGGRSDTPSGVPRQASTGNAPVNGTIEPGYIGGAGASTPYSGTYGAGASNSYPDTPPSPMFSPGGSQPPEGMRDPITAGLSARGSRASRDPAFPAFGHNPGLGLAGDEDLRSGLAGAGVANGHSPPEASSPPHGEIDDMFNQITNQEDGEEDEPTTLEHETSQAKEALEMIDSASEEADHEKEHANEKQGDSGEFGMESWTAD